jgi:hypothetical protein
VAAAKDALGRGSVSGEHITKLLFFRCLWMVDTLIPYQFGLNTYYIISQAILCNIFVLLNGVRLILT